MPYRISFGDRSFCIEEISDIQDYLYVGDIAKVAIEKQISLFDIAMDPEKWNKIHIEKMGSKPMNKESAEEFWAYFLAYFYESTDGSPLVKEFVDGILTIYIDFNEKPFGKVYKKQEKEFNALKTKYHLH